MPRLSASRPGRQEETDIAQLVGLGRSISRRGSTAHSFWKQKVRVRTHPWHAAILPMDVACRHTVMSTLLPDEVLSLLVDDSTCWLSCPVRPTVPCGQLLLGLQRARASACQPHIAHPEFVPGVIWGMTWVLLRLEENVLVVESYWRPRCG